QLPRPGPMGSGLSDQPRLRGRHGLRSLHRPHGRSGQPTRRRPLRRSRPTYQVRVMADATYVPDVGTPVRAEARGWRDSKALKRFRRNPLAVVGLLVVLAFVLTAIFAPVLTNVGKLGRASW